MNDERKIYHKSKNTYFLLINEKKINRYMNSKNEIVLNLIIDTDYNKHLIISKKKLEIRNNIYYERVKIRKNNKRSKDYVLNLNLVFSSLLSFKNLSYYLAVISIENKDYLDVVFM